VINTTAKDTKRNPTGRKGKYNHENTERKFQLIDKQIKSKKNQTLTNHQKDKKYCTNLNSNSEYLWSQFTNQNTDCEIGLKNKNHLFPTRKALKWQRQTRWMELENII
jgi:hypothetical protein